MRGQPAHMTSWQVTAKTIYCDAVDDEVTHLIYRDFSARCTGCQKYTQPDEVTLRLIRAKQRKLKRVIKCEGEGCPRIEAYRQQIRKEDGK